MIGEIMKKIIILLILVPITGILMSGCIESTIKEADTNALHTKVEMHGAQLDAQTKKEVESAILSAITPYKEPYSSINITVEKVDKKLHLEVIGKCDACEYPDRYDFTYSNQQMVLNGYILEAIPPSDRDKAIGIAMQKEEIKSLMQSGNLQSNPSVKRILASTSEKYYAPKTLISVTWSDYRTNSPIISALIDPDIDTVVKTWSSS